MKIIDGGVTAAERFQAAGLAAGIKKGNTKALGLFSLISDLIYRQASGQGEADRC